MLWYTFCMAQPARKPNRPRSEPSLERADNVVHAPRDAEIIQNVRDKHACEQSEDDHEGHALLSALDRFGSDACHAHPRCTEKPRMIPHESDDDRYQSCDEYREEGYFVHDCVQK